MAGFGMLFGMRCRHRSRGSGLRVELRLRMVSRGGRMIGLRCRMEIIGRRMLGCGRMIGFRRRMIGLRGGMEALIRRWTRMLLGMRFRLRVEWRGFRWVGK